MVFKQIQIHYCFTLLALYLIFCFSQNISQRFDKGLIVKNVVLQKLLWIRKNEVYISYPSLVFVIIGYIYLVALIPCNIVCLFVSIYTAELITYIYIGVTGLTWCIEVFFLPSYGIKG